ncbi:MAG: hypothetical protein IKA30_02465 [Alphaproteobacteria bacterium]|nr:hypothetical protein [Alphaproteobacteria bacterium]
MKNNMVEAINKLKLLLEVQPPDIIDYIRIPIFSEVGKEKIFDIVRKIGVNNNKSDITYLFTSEEYKKSKYLYNIQWIMMDINYDAFSGNSLYTRFMEEFTGMLKAEFDILNPDFAYEKCFESAYVSCVDEKTAEILEEWLNNHITLAEWQNLLLSIAKD